MKLKNIYTFLMLATLVLPAVQGCKKSFSDLYVDPNRATTSTSNLLLGGILAAIPDGPNTSNERRAQYTCSNYAYYATNDYDMGQMTSYYATIENVVKMEAAATREALPKVNAYSALAKFFKAYLFSKMSMQVGDIPMSQALQGLNNLTPAYDTQKQVFQQTFTWLEEANTDLTTLIAAKDNNLSGDFYFNNKLDSWQKLVNTLRLRLLIDLEKKASDPDLNIKQQFSSIVSNPAKYPLMKDGTDNWQFVYQYPLDKYPSGPDSYPKEGSRLNSSATYIGLLTALKDPRVFVTAEPAQAKLDAGISATSFDAFVGADPGIAQSIMTVDAVNGKYSFLNRKHYYDSYTGEPAIQVGFPEMCFNIAEAINHGWISSGPLGNAEAYYQAGIRASFGYYGIPDNGTFSAYFLQKGSPVGNGTGKYTAYLIPFDINTYFAQVKVKYSADPALALNQILTQKYLALFRHSGLQSYYTWRRTAVPIFTTGQGTSNGGQIALRFQYRFTELSANTANYNAALQRQYSGNDDINAVMWLLK